MLKPPSMFNKIDCKETHGRPLYSHHAYTDSF